MSALALSRAASGQRRARTSASRPRRRRSRSRSRSARCSARRSGSIRTGTSATTTTSTIPKPACRSRASSASSPIARRWNGSAASRASASIRTSAKTSPFGVEFADRVLPRRPRAALRAQLRSELLSLPVARERLVRHRRIRPRQAAMARPRSPRIRVERALRDRRQHRHPVPAVRSSSRSPTACAPAAPRSISSRWTRPQGHDAFLVDIPRFGAAIARLLSEPVQMPSAADSAAASRLRSRDPVLFSHEHATDCSHARRSIFPAPAVSSTRSIPPSASAKTIAITEALRNALCCLIRDRDVEAARLRVRARERPLRAARALSQRRARLQRRRDDLGPGPGHADPRPRRHVVRRRRLARHARDHAVRTRRAATTSRYRFEPRGTMNAGPGSAGSLIPPHEYHTIRNPSERRDRRDRCTSTAAR